MAPLSVQEPRLASNDRITITKLFKLGMGARDMPYTMDAAALGASGLSTTALVALARSATPKLLDADGVTELRPAGFVAREVTVRCTGEACFTLMVDLAA